jgi:starch-binding outer membrane protein, SusD/RagB family
MKLKYIKISVLPAVLATVAIINGCDKNKLDLKPTNPTEESFFKQENDFSQATFGVYAKLTDLYWFNANNPHSPMLFLAGDDITTNSSNEAFEIFSSLQPGNGDITSLWQTFYQMIARANVVLSKIETVPDGVYTTPNLKNYHKGEALFLRGYAYYNLWNYWGTAPLRNERVTKNEEFFPSPTEGTQLLEQAITDFTQAASLLPPSWNDANRGRVTANAANGMLGKCLVFKGSAKKSTTDFAAAITAFDKITGVSLTTQFYDNFHPANENNQESLFEHQATTPFGFDNVWLPNDFDNAIGSMSAYWGYYSDHWSLFGKSRFFATPKLVNAFTAGDPRLGLTLDASNRTIRKYVTPDENVGGGVGSANNPRLLRYADVLLLKAEAILQSGGSTTAAIELINNVRSRARATGTVPANYSTSETNTNTIMNWIMNERFIELAGEGQRWFDLRRWHMQGVITLSSDFFSSNVGVNFSPAKHLNMPIPNSELDVNKNMKQNEGY